MSFITSQGVEKTIPEIENDATFMLGIAVNHAGTQMTGLQGEIQHVAKETGLMRESIRNLLFTQLAQQTGNKRIKLTLSPQLISQFVPYPEFHWRVGPQGQYRYKNPTTPGTKPINPEQLMRDMKKWFMEKIMEELRRLQYV